jgi:hypothetical protein
MQLLLRKFLFNVKLQHGGGAEFIFSFPFDGSNYELLELSM